MINREQQDAVLAHLKEIAIVQKKVRNGEIEGMVFDLESSFQEVYYLGLINMYEFDMLINFMRNKNENQN